MMNKGALCHCIEHFLKSETYEIWRIAVFSVRNLQSKKHEDYQVMELGHSLFQHVHRIMQNGENELRLVLLIAMGKLHAKHIIRDDKRLETMMLVATECLNTPTDDEETTAALHLLKTISCSSTNQFKESIIGILSRYVQSKNPYILQLALEVADNIVVNGTPEQINLLLSFNLLDCIAQGVGNSNQIVRKNCYHLMRNLVLENPDILTHPISENLFQGLSDNAFKVKADAVGFFRAAFAKSKDFCQFSVDKVFLSRIYILLMQQDSELIFETLRV